MFMNLAHYGITVLANLKGSFRYSYFYKMSFWAHLFLIKQEKSGFMLSLDLVII